VAARSTGLAVPLGCDGFSKFGARIRIGRQAALPAPDAKALFDLDRLEKRDFALRDIVPAGAARDALVQDTEQRASALCRAMQSRIDAQAAVDPEYARNMTTSILAGQIEAMELLSDPGATNAR
jgi:hypothetical protein